LGLISSGGVLVASDAGPVVGRHDALGPWVFIEGLSYKHLSARREEMAFLWEIDKP